MDEGLGLACLADYNMNMPKWGGWWGKWNGDESKRRTVPAPKSHCLSQQQTVLTACTFPDRRAIVSRHSLIYFLISLPLFFRFTLFIPSGWDPAIAPEFGPDVHNAVSSVQKAEYKKAEKGSKRFIGFLRSCQFVYKIQATRRWTKEARHRFRRSRLSIGSRPMY